MIEPRTKSWVERLHMFLANWNPFGASLQARAVNTVEDYGFGQPIEDPPDNKHHPSWQVLRSSAPQGCIIYALITYRLADT